MITPNHISIWNKIWEIPGFFADPFLMFGFQEYRLNQRVAGNMKGRIDSFRHFLEVKGLKDITVIDWNDPRADLHVDMNHPLPIELKARQFKVMVDVGCIEHVLNTKQCLENCIEMVEVGGLYLIHTPVMGYHKHGFHVFNPDMLRWFLKNNGFEIIFDCYTSKQGEILEAPKGNTLIWLVAKKVQELDHVNVPIDNHGKIECNKEEKQ